MNLGTASVIRGNARDLPLADNSVDLVVTSPPYWSLRSYQDNGEHYDGQIGAEATPQDFVDSLIEVTRELVRVTKPSGSIWINLGDKYNAYNGNRGQGTIQRNEIRQTSGKGHGLDVKAVRPKSLVGIPWRYALACIDDLGLILRAEVIWSKPNGLPESVTDRVRRSHEQWFHFVLEPRYFSAVDEIREGYGGDGRKRGRSPHTTAGHPNSGGHDGLNLNGNENPLGKLPGSVWSVADDEFSGAGRDRACGGGCPCNPHRAGRDRDGGSGRPGTPGLSQGDDRGVGGSVWTVPTEPFRVPDHLGIDHFAAFPTEWPKRIIQGWSPAGVCVECGEGRRPVADVARVALTGSGGPSLVGGHGADGRVAGRARSEATITGYACACDPKVCRSCRLPSVPYCEGFRCCDSCTHGTLPDTRPSVILDPFGGTGTTALVAKALGRHGITVDMSADYCRLAEWRTNDRNQLAKVLGVEKAPEADVHQLDLFGEATA